MSRLPQPDSDDGQWGGILNDFLVQSHTADGLLRAGSVGSDQLQTAVIDKTKLTADVQTSLTKADASVSTTQANAMYVRTVNSTTPDGSGNVTVTSPAVTSNSITDATTTGKSLITAASATAAKTTVGLANVDNTSDVNKPVSTAAQTALNLRPAYVQVVTGTETRPSATFVIWVGGTSRPTNTLEGDLWFSETP